MSRPPLRAKQPWDILKEAPGRFDCLGNADDFPEEARPFTGKASPFSSNAEVLAGEPPAEKMARLVQSASCFGAPAPDLSVLETSHIVVNFCVWKSSGKDALAERLAFDLIDDGESGSSKTKIKSSNASKD